MAVIETVGLTKRYPSVTALDQLDVDRRRRRHRTGRRQRRRQVDADQDPARPGAGDRAARRAVLGHDVATEGGRIRALVGYMPEHDCLPADVSASDLVVHMGQMSGLPYAAARERAVRRAAPRRAGRGAVPADGRLLDRHEAARQARPGARARPAAGAPRRADQRARPVLARRHAGAGAADRQRVRDRGPGHLPPARRARAGQRPRRRARQRAAAPVVGDHRLPARDRQPARRGAGPPRRRPAARPGPGRRRPRRAARRGHA